MLTEQVPARRHGNSLKRALHVIMRASAGALLKTVFPIMQDVRVAMDAEASRRLISSLGSVGPNCSVGGFDLLTNAHLIHFGSNIRIRSHARMEVVGGWPGNLPSGEIRIGNGSHIESYVHIGAAVSVRIGREVVIGSRVTILDHDHGTGPRSSAMSQGLLADPVTVGDFCWLGEGAVLLKGVQLGPACIVGANAVVTKSFPAHSVLVGVPARVIATRQMAP